MYVFAIDLLQNNNQVGRKNKDIGCKKNMFLYLYLFNK